MKIPQSVQVSQLQQPVDLIAISQRNNGKTKSRENESFKDMFSQELAGSRGLSFSKHAQQRLYSRKIELSDDTLGRIADAVDRADSKGSQETLVLVDDAALVVSVTNRTVITAFDRDNLRDGIVTSIDSAVVL